MKNSSSVFPVCHCPCQRCSPTLLNQFEDLFGEVDFDPAFAPSARSPWDQCWGWYSCLETTRDLANSWNCALGNYGTFFPTFEHLKKLTSESGLTLEWPVGPHYNWFDTFMWRSSKRQEKMAHLQNDCSTCWVSGYRLLEVRVVRLQFPDEVPLGASVEVHCFWYLPN